MSSSEPDVSDPPDHCDGCDTALIHDDVEVWIFEVYSESKDELLERRWLCPECYDDVFAPYTDL
jgi:hypothetical protein